MDQYLSVLIPENYSSIQEDLTLKPEFNNLFSDKHFRCSCKFKTHLKNQIQNLATA